MQAKTIKGKTAEDILCLFSEITTDGFTPTLAIVFLSKKSNAPGIIDLFDKKGIAIFGVSSFGHFIDEDNDIDSIVVMLLDIKPEQFRIEFRETGDSNTASIASSIGEAGKAVFNKPAFIVASGGITTDGEKIIDGLEEAVGKNTSIFGGLAAIDFQKVSPPATFVFTNGKVSDNGLVAIVLDEDKISLKNFATGGCQPVGIFHTITKSTGNIVYTIDDQPAFDIVLRYCGKTGEGLNDQIDALQISSHFQIQLNRGEDSPIMRTIMYANYEDRSIVFAGSLPQGSKVKFSILPGFEVVENVVNEFREFSKKEPVADAMILFSCQGRVIAFGPWVSEEISGLNKIWGVPMIGMFSFGEIGCGASGKNDFHNMTCSLALLKENQPD